LRHRNGRPAAERRRRANDRKKAPGKASVLGRTEFQRGDALDVGKPVFAAPEAGERDLGTTGAQHHHPPAHGRIGQVMDEIQDTEHQADPIGFNS
jgi:hypothetical protein